MAHSRETALQVRTEYLDNMGKMYFSYFKDYYSKLLKMQVSQKKVEWVSKYGRKDWGYNYCNSLAASYHTHCSDWSV